MDYLIQNGRVPVPEGGSALVDIAVGGSCIVEIGKDLVPENGAQMIDAGGCWVCPGLIDFHMHVEPLSELGVCAEAACFPSGITTAVDCGSTGCANYPLLRPALGFSKVRTFAYLNVSSLGIATRSYNENLEPARFNRAKIAELFRAYPGELLGLKLRFSKDLVEGLGMAPLSASAELAGELGVPLVVHPSNAPVPIGEILRYLKKGDVLTHAYQNTGDAHYSILDENGRVSKEAWAARERGVIFDVANGNSHFVFSVAEPAIAEGFLPDTISTDMTEKNLYRRPNVFSLNHIMSKYLALGLSEEQVLLRVTAAPAGIMGHPELAEMKAGSIADIAILKVTDEPSVFGDRVGELRVGERSFRTMMTFREGMPVYRDAAF